MRKHRRAYDLDVHNRYESLTELGITPIFCDIPLCFECKEDAMIWIIEHQIERRNIQQYVRAALMLRKKDLLRMLGKGNMGLSPGRPPKKDPDWLKKPLVGNGKRISNDNDEKGWANLPKHETRETLAKEAGVEARTLNKVEKIEAEGS